MSVLAPFGVSLSAAFLAYVAVIAALVAAILGRFLPPGRALIGVAVLALWLGYAGVIGQSGIVGDPTQRPRGLFLLLAPVLLFAVMGIGRSRIGLVLSERIPLALLLAFQTFRVGVELTLSSLHDAGLASRLLTLPGGNVEFLVGLSAPLAALISTRGPLGRRIALIWTIAGLLSLLNVASRAVLTAPGPLSLLPTDVPSVAMGMFPFTFIPGFMAPLAVMVHILALRALLAAQPKAKTLGYA